VSAHASRAVLAMMLGVLAGCGGQTVEPLDPRDATLPPETRHWIADAQDGVIVARAQYDAMVVQVREVETWRDRMLDVKWSGGRAADVAKGMRALATSRLQVAEAELAYTVEFMRFAEAKHDLANAERAMLHDLAVYDLKPLRDDATAAKRAMGKAGDDTDRLRGELDKATERFWAAYAAHAAAGGQTVSFWASGGPGEAE